MALVAMLLTPMLIWWQAMGYILILLAVEATVVYFMELTPNKRELSSYFPLTVELKQEDLSCERYNPRGCAGHNALRRVLPSDVEVVWGTNLGTVKRGNTSLLLMSDVNLVEVRSPRKVTFKLYDSDDDDKDDYYWTPTPRPDLEYEEASHI